MFMACSTLYELTISVVSSVVSLCSVCNLDNCHICLRMCVTASL